MNLSGESVQVVMSRCRCSPVDTVSCRASQERESHAMTSAIMLKSVIYHFRGNREFPRLRIGIRRPPGQMDPKAFLLQKFNAKARERIDVELEEGVDVLKEVLSKGLTESARCFNTEQKYKHLRLQTMPV